MKTFIKVRKNNEIKKILACLLSATILLNFGSYKKVKAIDPVTTVTVIGAVVSIGGMVVNAVKYVVDATGKIQKVISERYDIKKYNEETERYQGLVTMAEATARIQDITLDRSFRRIYGQQIAKEQCLDALAGCLQNIYREISGRGGTVDKKGNVVYIIGGSGVGKSTMARAIAEAMLKYSSHTFFFINSSQINREQSLGDQLFRLTTKIANLKDAKTLGAPAKSDEMLTGTYDARVASPMLEHIFRWGQFGTVILIDEFEKMKEICTPPSAGAEYADKSADEIIKSIAENGYYMVGTEKIDCSKTLFLITTNETKEQLHANFGQGGARGGGIQRLNVIEFEDLDEGCCRKIVEDLANDVIKELTRPDGHYKLKEVVFSREAVDNMAKFIFSDKLKHARAKFDLEKKIYRMFIFEPEKFKDISCIINYVPALGEEKPTISEFANEEEPVVTAPKIGTFSIEELTSGLLTKSKLAITPVCPFEEDEEKFMKYLASL